MKIKHTAIAQMQEDAEFTPRELEIVSLLWDYLKKDIEHKDRRCTGWGELRRSAG